MSASFSCFSSSSPLPSYFSFLSLPISLTLSLPIPFHFYLHVWECVSRRLSKRPSQMRIMTLMCLSTFPTLSFALWEPLSQTSKSQLCIVTRRTVTQWYRMFLNYLNVMSGCMVPILYNNETHDVCVSVGNNSEVHTPLDSKLKPFLGGVFCFMCSTMIISRTLPHRSLFQEDPL